MMKKKKFCVITTQRSGSTWLSTLLDSHPQIKAFEEPFIWRKHRPNWKEKGLPTYYNFKINTKVKSPLTIFKYIDLLNNYDDEQKDIKTIGFKLMYNQILENPELLIKLISDKYTIVHLVRQNHLDILVSRASLRQNNAVHSKENQIKTKQVALDTSMLVKKLEDLERTHKIFRTVLKLMPLPVLEISYESLKVDKNKVLGSIADFLQVDDTFVAFESELKRINKGKYKEKISNYNQVMEILANTKYAEFIMD